MRLYWSHDPKAESQILYGKIKPLKDNQTMSQSGVVTGSI